MAFLLPSAPTHGAMLEMHPYLPFLHLCSSPTYLGEPRAPPRPAKATGIPCIGNVGRGRGEERGPEGVTTNIRGDETANVGEKGIRASTWGEDGGCRGVDAEVREDDRGAGGAIGILVVLVAKMHPHAIDGGNRGNEERQKAKVVRIAETRCPTKSLVGRRRRDHR